LLASLTLGGCSFSVEFDESTGAGTSSSKNPTDIAENSASGDERVEQIVSGDLSIHFLELGNKYTGDCTLIKAGDTEVLIDAGSRKGSASTIANYIDEYCTDGVLEYVIATHAHQDHIAGFVGTKTAIRVTAFCITTKWKRSFSLPVPIIAAPLCTANI
jgi:beta-lactamase superfamily II metal-dependent hydrolase